MQFITNSGIHFEIQKNAEKLLSKYPHDKEKIYSEAKRNVAYYGLTSSEYKLHENLATLKMLQETVANIPYIEITISPGYDGWDQNNTKHGMFDIVINSETVYSYAMKGEVLAYLAATRRCENCSKGT